jgi:diguanylate cyclase (GGDEF)-like protein/PAS domain S-box-containing protein
MKITKQHETPPHLGNETGSLISEALSKKFLKFAIVVLMVAAVSALLALRLIAPDQNVRVMGPLLVLVIVLTGWYFLRRGRIQIAKNVMAFGLWGIVTGVAIFTGGTRAPVVTTYPVLILVVAWILSSRAAVVITCLTVAATAGMVAGEAWGVMPAPLPSLPIMHGGDQVVIYVLSIFLAVALVQAYKNRLQELQEVGISLSARTVDLEASKAELHRAQAVAKVGNWVYDLASDTMRLSAETCRIFGLPDGTAGSHDSCLARAHADDRGALDRAWQAALQGDSFDHVHRIRIGDEIRWIRQQAELEFAADGMAIRAVGVAQDITERTQAERALRVRDERFQLLFNRASEGIVVLRPGGVFVAVNDSFARMHGYAAQEMHNLTLKDLDTPQTLPFLAQRIERILAGETLTFEVEHYHKDGHVVPLEVTSSLIVSDGEPLIQAFHRDISERRRAQGEINSLAFYDPLTSLPNRRLLLDRLTQALTASARDPAKNALLFVDLDNFKTLNDTRGHLQGDGLLTHVAQRLVACMRKGDTVARLGSDEFVVLLENLSCDDLDAATQTEAVAEKILASLARDYQLDSGPHHCTSSIGITLFGGNAHESSQEPLKRAELAMYQAKAAGRNTLRFFDQQMQVDVTIRVALEADLREAVSESQFVLFYQAQVVGTGRITGVEALLRWQHPRRGLVTPADFIVLAEETGLILPLGKWVLQTACHQLAFWATRPALAHLTMAVNVSARQFLQQDFVEQVLSVLDQSGANPKQLKLELTESMLVQDIEGIIIKMDTLKSRGVSFSLDDFGTGYSSLSYLKRLPLGQLKIDQGFVRNIVTDPNDAAIAKMVVALADSVGLSVIAEGVELEAQRDFLAGLGCHAYQGYLFSRPLPIDAFEAFAMGLDAPAPR